MNKYFNVKEIQKLLILLFYSFLYKISYHPYDQQDQFISTFKNNYYQIASNLITDWLKALNF